jgi:hypothetical protein
MKKILIILIFIALPLLIQAQLSGSGTKASPYSGTFESDLQWNSTNFTNGKVFIDGDVTIDDEELVIEAGMNIIFITEGADLIITGTGQLTADGTSGSMIRFTADDDDDGNYGETGERWGHIVFDNPSEDNQSKLEYSIIEYGDVRSGSNTTSYGGALYLNSFNNLLVNNCTIRFNKATHGGAIMLFSGSSPNISNCLITENSANTSGGAFYSQSRNNLLLSNCIISFNSSGSGGGGALFLDGIDNSRFINCTIVKNTTTATERGHNIQFYNISGTAARPRFINSIIWDSDNSIGYSSSSTTAATDFINCAIRDTSTPASSFTNCIDLNITNDNATGPNFLATDGSDWSIKFISPCRDKGVNSYTGVTIPSTDYDGDSRVYTTDIGAYEVQYSRWLTNATAPTSWSTAGNWEDGIYPGISGGTGDVVIPSLTNDTYAPLISGTTTIASGKSMILEPGAKATFGTLSNSGTLRLEADADSVSSLILTTYTDSGTEEIELYLTGGSTPDNKWHYISSPVSSLSTNVFTSATLNLAQYVESRPTGSLLQGWVAYDGYVYSTGISDGPTFSSLSPGRAYNYYDATDNLFTFSGSLNTSNAAMSLGYSSTASYHGFNLLGNPFSSGLDWDQIIDDSYFTYPSETSKSLYFTRDNEQCTYASGVGVPSDVTGIIPPMQGFFVKTYATGKTITLPAAARTHNSIHPRYKGKSIIPLVRLAITDNEMSDETVVRFDAAAKAGQDYDFDAVKMFISDTKTQVWSSLSGTDYAINGQPFPETLVEIPIVVNLTSDGTHSISTSQLQGLDNYTVTLTDNVSGFIANLRTTPTVTFTASAGTISDRFILKISNVVTGTENPVTPSNSVFNIYEGYGHINIQTMGDEWDGLSGSVRVLDLAGRIVADQQNREFSKNSVVQVQGPGARGMYIVEIRSGVKRYVGKVLVR